LTIHNSSYTIHHSSLEVNGEDFSMKKILDPSPFTIYTLHFTIHPSPLNGELFSMKET
jgi:hypothetical protein